MTLNKQVLPADVVERLRDLIGQYFDLGYAEGVTGRAVDTMAGEAQAAWSEIDALITSLEVDLAASETSHDAARANFLIMQGAAAELLKRAQKAEAERDEALSWFDGLPFSDIDALIARLHARISVLTEALEKIACRHVTEQPLWWQIAARTALNPKGVSDNG